jgi:hypothetical protein
MWCNVVTTIEVAMKKKQSRGKRRKAQSRTAIRASISFPPDLYATLEQIAKQKKVSLAWVVRDASEKYVCEPMTAAKGQ